YEISSDRKTCCSVITVRYEISSDRKWQPSVVTVRLVAQCGNRQVVTVRLVAQCEIQDLLLSGNRQTCCSVVTVRNDLLLSVVTVRLVAQCDLLLSDLLLMWQPSGMKYPLIGKNGNLVTVSGNRQTCCSVVTVSGNHLLLSVVTVSGNRQTCCSVVTVRYEISSVRKVIFKVQTSDLLLSGNLVTVSGNRQTCCSVVTVSGNRQCGNRQCIRRNTVQYT
ncbi:hypothetical protein L9F63_009799, partial [Diploptera punctata]